MKKSTPKLPSSSRMQMSGGAKEMPKAKIGGGKSTMKGSKKGC